MLHASGADDFIKRNADGSCRCIAIAIDIHIHMILRQSQTLCDRLNDAIICLMGNEHIDIFLRDAGGFQGLQRGRTHVTDSGFEYFRPLHMDIDTAGVDGAVGHKFSDAARWDIQDLAQAAV